MKRIKSFYKIIASTLVAILFTVFCTPVFVVEASYWDHHRYYRHDDHHWSSRDTWIAIGGIALVAAIANSSSHSSKTYSEKFASIVDNFKPEEQQIFKTLDHLPKGKIQIIQYFDEADLKLVKNVMKELYGEYIYLATYRQDNINWVLFYKFSTIYKNKKLSGDYEDFVASDLMANLAYGTHVLPYESKLAKALLTTIKYSYPNSHGYRDGDYFIIEKQ